MTKIIFILGNLIPSVYLTSLICFVLKCFHINFFFIYLIIYLYFLPVLLYRLINLFFSGEEGKYEMYSRPFLIWWWGIQFQAIYARFAFLEEFLRMFPLLYSFWLRLWGAKIGKHVYWSPKVFIADRGDLEVGDFSVVGYGVKMTAHLLTLTHGRYILLRSKVIIKNNVLIGAESSIGPGALINSFVNIAALSVLLPFSVWNSSKEYIQIKK